MSEKRADSTGEIKTENHRQITRHLPKQRFPPPANRILYLKHFHLLSNLLMPLETRMVVERWVPWFVRDTEPSTSLRSINPLAARIKIVFINIHINNMPII